MHTTTVSLRNSRLQRSPTLSDSACTEQLGGSLNLHVTTLTLSLIVTLTLQSYPNPTYPNHVDPDPNRNPDVQILTSAHVGLFLIICIQ